MKRFELSLTVKTENNRIESIDRIEANTIVQLLSQFQFIILNIQKQHIEEMRIKYDLNSDDIPF